MPTDTEHRIIFLGQAPAKPGSRHGVAGTYIRPWLYRIGLDDTAITQRCRFYALMGTFPGSDGKGHLRPSQAQIAEHRPFLVAEMLAFRPHVFVPVGGMAISETLPEAGTMLSDIVGKSFSMNPFGCLDEPITVIPLPHPSGRSTWLHQHKHLLDEALRLLENAA